MIIQIFEVFINTILREEVRNTNGKSYISDFQTILIADYNNVKEKRALSQIYQAFI